MNIIKDMDFHEFIGKQQSQSVERFEDYKEEALYLLRNPQKISGDKMPWLKTHEDFGFRGGEITIWAGVNGNGKSLVMGQVALWLAKTTKVLIASMEMTPSRQLGRIYRQMSGSLCPTDSQVDDFHKLTSDNLWVYNKQGSVEANQIIGMCHWAAKEQGIKHIMIDSIVMCRVNQKENMAQRDFVNSLAEVARTTGCHIHLVNHIRKPDSQNVNKMPTKFDIKGAGEITDLADNVLIVHIDQVKKESKRKGDSYDKRSFDCFISLDKQRHGETNSEIWGFFWHSESLQWLEDYPLYNQPMKWL